MKRTAIFAALLLVASAGLAEEVKFTCSRDVWVSATGADAEGGGGKEYDASMGKTPTMKLKTIQEMCILDFDLSSLKHKTVDGGWLYFHIVTDPKEVERIGIDLPRKHFLKGIGVSTVSSDWVEGKAKVNYTVDKAGFGASFREASHSKRPWAWPGSDLTDVTFSNGNTLQHHADLEEQAGLWARVKVPAHLIQSLAVRDGFGWCLMDEIGYGLANNFIHSREQNRFAPYLVVNVIGEDKTAPAAPKVSVRPAPGEAHMATGAVAIEVAGPADAFCYFVKINGKDCPRWRIPHPKAGKSTIVLDDRKGGEPIAVEAVSCDAAGNRSAAGKASGKASPALAAVPALPASSWKPKPGNPPVRSGKMKVWALPEICKVKYHNGQLFEAAALGVDPLAYTKANSVWEGATNTVRTFGARGEIVAFQLCLERQDADKPLTGISIALDGLTGPGKIDADRVRLFRVWYVGLAEYAVPLPGGAKIEIPYKANKLRHRQMNQQVYVDIAIPPDAKSGDYTGRIAIAADGVEAFTLPVKLKVYDFAIPDKMRFNPELNIYQAPGRPGSKTWFASYRVAHYNRCTLSITQAGHSDGVKVPVPIAGQGANVRVRDFNGFDKAYGPLLSGEAFRDLPRAGQPLATCQIPLSQGFPLPVDRYHIYRGPKRVKNVDLIHALSTPADVAKTFTEDYKQGFRKFVAQICRHIESKGWTDTSYQFYLDAKVHWRINGRGTSYWILDEPYNYPDWMALKFWGELFHQGIKPVPKKARWGYRCDISRPHWTRDWLNGVMNIMYAGGFQRRTRRCMTMAREGPFTVYAYGACNRPNLSHWNSAAWCLSTFAMGGDGVLPWQSLGSATGGRGKASSLAEPDPHGLIIPDALGHGAIGSIRIMALRRGAQTCEYLMELGAKRGLNREQLRAVMASKVAPKGTLRQLHEDDAAPVSFEKLDPDRFAELREGLARLIVQK